MSKTAHNDPPHKTDHTDDVHYNHLGTTHQLSHQAIATLAYEKFEKRGSKHGHHAHDWSEAENELRAAPRRKGA